MSNETMVQNGAVEKPRKAKNKCHRSSVGKVARLPKDIREELNRRLDDGQATSEILPWVNGLPAAKTVLDKHFRGVPISYRNITEWRQKGYQRWLERQVEADDLRMLADDAMDFSEAAGITLARGTASIAAAKILKLLPKIPAEQGSIDDLTKISYAVSALLNADQNQVRLEHDKTRVDLRHEQVTLQWDKHQRDRVTVAQRVLNDAQIKAIQESDIDNSLKIEMLGQRLFGELWQGREISEEPFVAQADNK